MKKILSLIIALSILTLTLPCFALAEEKVLVVGTNAEFPPFEYYENGELIGFDIDLMCEIGKRLGYRIEFKDFAFDALINNLASGKVDCIIAGISITEERLEVVDFSIPYGVFKITSTDGIFIDEYAIAVRKGEPDLLNNINAAISALRADGTIDMLLDKYTLEEYKGDSKTVASESTPAPDFTDIPETHWARPYIHAMLQLGIMSSMGDGGFAPDTPISRAQYATIVSNLIGTDAAEYSGNFFADVSPESWYAPYVEGAREYMNSYSADGQTLFKPNENAAREDVVTSIIKLGGYDTAVYSEAALRSVFNDVDSMSANSREYLYTAICHHLVSGYDDGSFRPQGSITRAETAVLLCNLIDDIYFGGSADEPSALGNIELRDYMGNVLLDSRNIAGATPSSDGERYYVNLILNYQGKTALADATEKIAAYTDDTNFIAVYLDGTLLHTETITSKTDTELFSFQAAQGFNETISDCINSGEYFVAGIYGDGKGFNMDIADVQKSLGVPERSDISYKLGEEYFWKAGNRYCIHVRFYQNGKLVAYATVDSDTGAHVRDVHMYSGDAEAPIATLEFTDCDGNVVLNGDDVESAEVLYFSEAMGWGIELTLTNEGRSKFAEETERIASYIAENKNYIAIAIGGDLISAPQVHEKIDSDTVVLSGYTKAEATELAERISAV